jgi:hypothetical protein
MSLIQSSWDTGERMQILEAPKLEAWHGVGMDMTCWRFIFCKMSIDVNCFFWSTFRTYETGWFLLRSLFWSMLPCKFSHCLLTRPTQIWSQADFDFSGPVIEVHLDHAKQDQLWQRTWPVGEDLFEHCFYVDCAKALYSRGCSELTVCWMYLIADLFAATCCNMQHRYWQYTSHNTARHYIH